MKRIIRIMITVFCCLVLTRTPNVLAADEEANKEILKNAVTGAITGAVATEATKDDKPVQTVSQDAQNKSELGDDNKHHHGHKKGKFAKDKKRPHGWDQGKKTGWQGGDEPPGLAKKH